jgi:osmotically-inducible protein OsmY
MMRRFQGPLAGLSVAALVTLGGSAAADDAQSRGRIEQRLEAAKLQSDVAVVVKGDAATLTGVVATLDARARAEKLALKEVRSVDNQVKVWVEPRDPQDLIKDIRKAVLSYPQLSVFDDIRFELAEGGVRLLGSVNQPYRKRDIEQRVARVRGLASIRNDLEVQPVSIFDDRLRAQLYRRIYASGRFANYAVQVNPPVRIVVARGRVTLSGVVNSRVDQMLMGIIARETMAFGVDNQLVVEGERDKEPKPAKGATQV